MLVLDTSIWIEWLTDSTFGRQLIPLYPPRLQCVVPTMVQLELAKWALRTAGVAQMRTLMNFTRRCTVVPLDARLARGAALVHKRYKLATADAIIYASALQHEVRLLTCDAHFAHLPAAIYIPKP